MKRVVVDMDGVLCDLLPTWLAAFGRHTGHYIHPESILTYGFEAYIPEELRGAFFDILGEALQHAPPMRGTCMLEALGPADLELVLVSYVHPAAHYGHDIKLRWLKQWFPAFEGKLSIMNGERAYLQADYLIDDNPSHIAAWLENNPLGRAFLVKHEYNVAEPLPYGCQLVQSFDEAVWEILADDSEGGIIS